jgi:hypothetical protein
MVVIWLRRFDSLFLLVLMPQDIYILEAHLASKHKPVRLKALKLILRHPDATPIQLARCLCSDDNRNFEFIEVFELGSAMRESWSRLRDVKDDEVYGYLSSLLASDPTRNARQVVHFLELLSTRGALEMLQNLLNSTPADMQSEVKRTISRVSQQIVSDRK